jgi:hypothetical protein
MVSESDQSFYTFKKEYIYSICVTKGSISNKTKKKRGREGSFNKIK